MSEIVHASAVRFDSLSATDDGYTLLSISGKVCKSDKLLSKMIQSAVDSEHFATEEWVSTNYYNVDEVNDFLDEKYDTSAFKSVSGTFLTAHQNLDDYATKNWVEEQNYITGVDLSNYYTKSETSGRTEIANALTAKQNVIQSKKNSSLPYLETANGEPSWEVIENEQINAHGTAQEGEVYNTTINGRTYTMVCLNGKLWLAENYVDEAKDIYTDSKYGSYFTEATIKLANFVPQGWHLPSKEEYQELIDYTENHEKYLATTDWHTLNYQGNPDPNYIAGTNELKLNILPGGEYYNNTLHSNEYMARFWTSTDEIHAQSTGKQRIYVRVSNYIGSTRILLSFDMSGPGSQNCYNVRLIKDDLDVSGPDCWKTFKGKNFMAIADNEGNTFKDFYLKKAEAQTTYQPIGNYASSAGVETLNTYYALTTTGWKDIAEGFYDKTSIDNSLSLKQDKLTFAGEDNTITAINSSAIGGSMDGDYVPLSATDCTIGNNVTAIGTALAQGIAVYAADKSIAVGQGNSADNGSLSVGTNNSAAVDSIAVGYNNTAKNNGIAQGYQNSAFGEYSIALGNMNKATSDFTFAQGRNNTVAGGNAIAFGQNNSATYSYTFAVGNSNSAIYAHAVTIGSQNIASGEFSVALSQLNSAYGNNAIVAGYKNFSKGHQSVALGYLNSVSGDNGVAIGYNNKAYSAGSVAIGYSNTSKGNYSVAEGFSNYAEGEASHAEGAYNQAIGPYSHAEGLSARATGNYSHAEGQNTYAGGLCDHVEGMGGNAGNGGLNHIEGFQYRTYGSNGVSEFFNTNKIKIKNKRQFNGYLYDLVKAFKEKFIVSCDYVDSSEYHYTGGSFYTPILYKIVAVELDTSTDDLIITLNDYITKGQYGMVLLLGPTTISSIISSGNSLTSNQTINQFTLNNLGFPGNNLENVRIDNTFISISYYYTPVESSTQLQFYKNLSLSNIEYDDAQHQYVLTLSESIEIPEINGGGYSYSVYVMNIPYYGCNHIEGQANRVESCSNAHIEGYNNEIRGNMTHAEGNETSAINLCCHSEGKHTLASNSYSHAEGYNTSATGQVSHSEGYNTYANGDHSHAEGYGSSAYGKESHAEGYYTKAATDRSHSEGYMTSAIGGNSHSEGDATLANNGNTHSEGWHTSAMGNCSHVEGETCLASGSYSHAQNYRTSALNAGSHAEGSFTIAVGAYSHSEGNATITEGENAHAEGNSTIASGDNSHAEGWSTIAVGARSHTEGYGTSAYDNDAHAEGSETIASGYATHAEGWKTVAKVFYAHAEGDNTSALGIGSHAEGWFTIADDMFMHAQGRCNKTSAHIAFVIGNGNVDNNNVIHRSDAFIVDWNGVASATNLQTSAGYVVTDVMLTSSHSLNESVDVEDDVHFVTNGVADLTPLYTYIKSLEDRIAALEAAQGGDSFTVNGIQPTVNGNTITVGE